MKLPLDFYTDEDTINIAKQLLGKVLYTNIDNVICSGIIYETEAYCGIEDKACHAYNNKITNRNKVMYLHGGVSYIYLCYGLHHLFNVVTNKKNIPHAVLIRAIKPLEGIKQILKRRRQKKLIPNICNGPGNSSQAMGIKTELNGQLLNGNIIWIEDLNIKIEQHRVESSPRIGIDYAQEYANMPWRFFIK